MDELILRKILLLVCVYTSFTSKGLRQLRKKKVEDERKWKDEKTRPLLPTNILT